MPALGHKRSSEELANYIRFTPESARYQYKNERRRVWRKKVPPANNKQSQNNLAPCIQRFTSLIKIYVAVIREQERRNCEHDNLLHPVNGQN